MTSARDRKRTSSMCRQTHRKPSRKSRQVQSVGEFCLSTDRDTLLAGRRSMGNKLPLLKLREVRSNLKALGFVHKRTDGSHETWERLADHIISERKVVQLDAKIDQFDKFLMKNMIRTSGFTQEEFCTGIIKAPSHKQSPVLTPMDVSSAKTSPKKSN